MFVFFHRKNPKVWNAIEIPNFTGNGTNLEVSQIGGLLLGDLFSIQNW